MHSNKPFKITVALVAATLMGAMATPLAAANNEIVIYAFPNGSDGGYPSADLLADSAGNLYGTTLGGGAQGLGTVFELSPIEGGWSEQVLYSFQSGDGAPSSGVIADAAGNLYGETSNGGADNAGTVYELTLNRGAWTKTTLYSFVDQTTGSSPSGGLAFDLQGSLYGTTPAGGDPLGLGTVFQLSPNGQDGWKEKVIHAFGRGRDGGLPAAGVVFDSQGNLFGTTFTGYGGGTIFELISLAKDKWKRKVLHRFSGGKDGEFPSGKLIFDAAGNLYSTAQSGGAAQNQNGCDFGCGTVYKLTPGAKAYKFTVLYSFTGGMDGRQPDAAVAFDSLGNLYGTTETGGGNGCDFGYGCGTAFELSPTAKGPWTETVLHRFHGSTDGLRPQGSLIPDAQGNWYGTTAIGGTSNAGTVFELTP